MGKPEMKKTRAFSSPSPVFHYLVVVYTGTAKKSRKNIFYYIGFFEGI